MRLDKQQAWEGERPLKDKELEQSTAIRRSVMI